MAFLRVNACSISPSSCAVEAVRLAADAEVAAKDVEAVGSLLRVGRRVEDRFSIFGSGDQNQVTTELGD